MSSQATEQATPQRKKKAREGGDRARSRDLLSGAALLAGLLALHTAGDRFAPAWKAAFAATLGLAAMNLHGEWDTPALLAALRHALAPAWTPVLAVMGASFAAALAAGFAQSGGLQLSAKGLTPSLARVNPATHLGQLFSVRSLVRLAKSLVPASAVAYLGWGVVERSTHAGPVLGLNRLPQTLDEAFGLGLKAAMVMVVWSGIDYVAEWRAWSQRLKMSKQEIREEMKDAMGNPQVKGRIRQIQRSMRKRKAKVDMARASVLVTNPTHYAVALEFSFETMQAPTVLTKGRDLHALDLREEARWAGVPIVENPPLARSLYRAVEPGRPIPYELYAAIAGILAYLYRQKTEEQARDTQARSQREAESRVRVQPALRQFQGGM